MLSITVVPIPDVGHVGSTLSEIPAVVHLYIRLLLTVGRISLPNAYDVLAAQIDEISVGVKVILSIPGFVSA